MISNASMPLLTPTFCPPLLINFSNASLHNFANWHADGGCKGPVLMLIPGPSCLSYLMNTAAMSKTRHTGPLSHFNPRLVPLLRGLSFRLIIFLHVLTCFARPCFEFCCTRPFAQEKYLHYAKNLPPPFALKSSLRYQHRYAWGLRLQAPLPTARILPKPTKDWLKARPIISFFRTWAAPLRTVFGALIFELTKITFPDVPAQLSVQDLVHQLWEVLSSADPTE